MASRNVDLIFRAKDDASKALASINAAMEEIAASQLEIARGAKPLSAALDGSAASAEEMATALARVTDGAANKAQTAYGRIEKAVEAANADFRAQRVELEANEQKFRDLKAQAEGAARAIAQQGKVNGPFQTGNGLNERLVAAEKAYKSLTAQTEQLQPKLTQQTGALDDSADRLQRVEKAALVAAAAMNKLGDTEQRVQRLVAARAAGRKVDAGVNESVKEALRLEQRLIAQERAAAARPANDAAANGLATMRKRYEATQDLIRAEAELERVSRMAAAANGRTSPALAEAAARAAREAAAAQMSLAAAYRGTSSASRPALIDTKGLAQELRRLTGAADQGAAGMIRHARGVTNARVALRAFYGDSRRALSLMQRMRGEVLSLTASFVGFYGIQRLGGSFLDAFKRVQAAQNKFSAAFEQDSGLVASEMAYIRAEADRLGISFDTLATTYSKYLISGQQAGLATEQIRKSFTQVTEAARVLNLSNDDIDGVLTAMSQIAGKGTLQMEELRQQLGDRLPGAVGIMAKALGYGEDELAQFYDDVTANAISAERALVALGNGLEATYGAQLEEALDSVTRKMGSLQNLLFQRQLTAANSGFIEGLEVALEALNKWLSSDEGIAFFESLGAAFGQIFELLPGVLDYFGELVFLGKALVAVKIGQVIGGMVGSFTGMIQASTAGRQATLAFNASLYAVSPAAFTAMTATGRLGLAMRGLRAIAISTFTSIRAVIMSVGGPLGLLITALSFFAINSLGKVDESVQATDRALSDHEDTLGKIRAAYLAAGDGADDWREKLEGVTEIEIEAQLARLRDELNKFQTSGDNTLDPDAVARLQARAQTSNDLAAINSLIEADRAFKQGRLSGEKYLETIVAVGKAAPQMFGPDELEAFVQVARRSDTMEKSIAQAEAELRLMRGTATDADKDLIGLARSADDAGDSLKDAAEGAAELQEKMDELKSLVPSLKEEMDDLADQQKMRDLVGEITTLAIQSSGAADSWERIVAAMKDADAASAGQGFMDLVTGLGTAAAQIMEAIGLQEQANLEGIQAGVDGDYGSYTSGIEATAALLRDREGFQPTGKWDVNAFRAGYGSDTVTLDNGTIVKITEGMAVSVADAERDLYRRIRDEFMPIARNITGKDRFEAFTPQQQAALTSIAYNYGTLPDRIISAVRTGTTAEIGGAIRSLGGDNGGVNRGRRNEEAALFESTANVAVEQEAAAQAREDEADAAKDRAQAQEDFHTAQQESLATSEFETANAKRALVDREVAAALREAELAAQKAGAELTAQERADIERTTRAKFAQAGLDEARGQSLEEASKLEAEITRLQERQAFLKEQEVYLREQGDVTGADAAKSELEGVNAELETAIQNALDFWEALGGEGSAAAIQGLEQTQAELARLGSQSVTTGKDINESIANSAASAFNKLAQNIAAGMPPLQALGQAFQQIAADILIELGQMIVKQALFNALTAGGTNTGGGIGGFLSGLVNGMFKHGGGMAGTPSRSASFNPAVFANAVRYHTGGIAGLAPDEIPTILREGEEVLTEGDPRHRFNGGKGSGDSATKIVNAFDADGFLDAALGTAKGERLILNFVRANAQSFKAAMGA